MPISFHSHKIFITGLNLSSQIFTRYFNTIKTFLQNNLPENYTHQQLQQSLMKIDYSSQSSKQNYKNFTQKIKQHPQSNLLFQQKDIGICLSSTGIVQNSCFNQVKGIRAALVHSEYIAKMCRQHNNANICIISTDCIGEQLAANLIYTYLINQFDNQVKNKIRLKLMEEFEGKYQHLYVSNK